MLIFKIIQAFKNMSSIFFNFFKKVVKAFIVFAQIPIAYRQYITCGAFKILVLLERKN